MRDTPDWLNDVSLTLHDDDDAPFDGLVALIRRCLGLDDASARAWARHVSRTGAMTFGPWSEPVARAVLAQWEALAPRYGCGSMRIELESSATESLPPKKSSMKARDLLREHFHDGDLTELSIVKREFPVYLRVDVQRTLETMTKGSRQVGVHARNRWDASDLAALVSERDQGKHVGALQFEDVDIGESEPVRLPTNCLSLFERGGVPLAMWINTGSDMANVPQLSVEFAAPPGEAAAREIDALLGAIESAVAAGSTYRGKILSLEGNESYSGTVAGALTVHDRVQVAEGDLVLSAPVRDAIDRHVFGFTTQRKALIALGQSGRKGVLLYGPPGTGKTHTIRYLAQRLTDHTTFLVTAEQIGLIATYFRLARLFAPSMVVIEDADLIARQREQIGSACEEVMLNRLLNEMDGLRPDAEILVVMTTNRPEALEAALLQRPGRIDHAIEIPVPDAPCRERLFRLYGSALAMEEAQLARLVERTEGVTASFIKELARRLAQRSIQAGHVGRVDAEDVDAVLSEMLSEREGLNLRLLGGAVA